MSGTTAATSATGLADADPTTVVAPDGSGARREAAIQRERPVREEPRSRAVPPTRASRVVVKNLDAWSVLKVSLLFYLSMFLMLLVTMVLLWAAATSIGAVGNIEGFMDSIGFTDFTFEAPQLLRGAALGGAVLVVAGTFGNVVMAVLYNLIADVVGGLRVTLGEDESARRAV